MHNQDNVKSANVQEPLAPVKKRTFSKESAIAAVAVAGIAVHLALRFLLKSTPLNYDLPLFAALLLAGAPLVYALAVNTLRKEFGSDLLARLSIVVSVVLGAYRAGTLVVLMLACGHVLEAYAVRSASSRL